MSEETPSLCEPPTVFARPKLVGEKKCGTCRFWQKWVYRSNPERDSGDCRIRAPVVIGVGSDFRSDWPSTSNDEWCGEWEDADQTQVGRR